MVTQHHILFAVIFALHLVAVAWHRSQRAKGFPINTFLFDPRCRYSDLTMPWTVSQRPNPYDHPGITNVTPYFPLYYWLMHALSRNKLMTVTRALYLAGIFVMFRQWGWPALALAVTYPALISDDRGGYDYVVCSIAGAGVALLFGGHPVYGAATLAVSVALKGYTAPFGLLWLLAHEWVGLGTLAVASVGLVLLPAHGFAGGIKATFRFWSRCAREFRDEGILAKRGLPYSTAHYCVDWFNAVRLIQVWRGRKFDAARWLKPYVVLTTVWAFSLAWVAATTGKPWLAVLALGTLPLVWPTVTNDYKLCVLFPGLAAGAFSGAQENWLLLGSAAILLVPKHYWFPRPRESWGSISCILNPVAMVGLTVGIWLEWLT